MSLPQESVTRGHCCSVDKSVFLLTAGLLHAVGWPGREQGEWWEGTLTGTDASCKQQCRVFPGKREVNPAGELVIKPRAAGNGGNEGTWQGRLPETRSGMRMNRWGRKMSWACQHRGLFSHLQ